MTSYHEPLYLKEKPSVDAACVEQMRAWLTQYHDLISAAPYAFREYFEPLYNFYQVPSRHLRNIFELCSTDIALRAVLRCLLRPEHFGDIESGDSYLDHITWLEHERAIDGRLQFWLHRTALQYVFHLQPVSGYARRSLGEVKAFSLVSDITLDALILMSPVTDGESRALFETICVETLDAWYANHPAYVSVRALYSDPKIIRQSMQSLKTQGDPDVPGEELPDALI